MLVTGRDILHLWVARMIMMGLEFRGEVPFHDVYITSIIQAADGRRMSKSLGTGVDPIDAIAEHGADALRFGLLVMSSTQDVRWSAEKVEQGQGLANKLYNASRLVVLSIDPEAAPRPQPSAIEDRWILSRLLRIDRQLHDRLGSYDFAHAALELYDFIYGELCDWYLELIKPRLREPTGELSSTLRFVLRETLTLAHPIIPFVTEEMWAYVRDEDEGLLAGRVPARLADSLFDPQACEALDRVIAAVQAVRSWRNSVGIAPGAWVLARIDADGYDAVAHLVGAQARLELRERGSNGAEPAASVPVPGGAIAILDGIDREAHEQRSARRREKLEAEISRAKGKLENASFVANAPPEVVAKERAKLAALERELGEL